MNAADLVTEVRAAGADLRLGGRTGIEIVRYRRVNATTIDAIREQRDEIRAFLARRALLEADDTARAARLLSDCRWTPWQSLHVSHGAPSRSLQAMRRTFGRALSLVGPLGGVRLFICRHAARLMEEGLDLEEALCIGVIKYYSRHPEEYCRQRAAVMAHDPRIRAYFDKVRLRLSGGEIPGI